MINSIDINKVHVKNCLLQFFLGCLLFFLHYSRLYICCMLYIPLLGNFFFVFPLAINMFLLLNYVYYGCSS